MSKRPRVQPSKSSFSDLLKLHEGREGEEGSAEVAPAPAAGAGKRGGKSSDPDYVKLTSYIRRETHLKVKKRLLDEGKEISELVEELMGKWLAEQ